MKKINLLNYKKKNGKWERLKKVKIINAIFNFINSYIK